MHFSLYLDPTKRTLLLWYSIICYQYINYNIKDKYYKIYIKNPA